MAADLVTCDLCERAADARTTYVVQIDVYADPGVPQMSAEQVEAMDFDQTFAALMDQMKDLTADELQDGVHRRFQYRLCPSCQRQFLANPLGKPRVMRAGTN